MNSFFSLLRKRINNLGGYPTVLLVVWLVLLLALPLVWKFLGARVLHLMLELTVLAQALLVLNILNKAWGWWGVLRASAAIFLLSWATFAILLRAGYPFTGLRYSDLLQPQVYGVPLLLPLIWLMMLPPAWAVARLATQMVSGCLMRPVFTLVSAAAFTAWDFYFDPLMVRWGLWEWNHAGGFFGIPWMNFAVWFISSAVITFAISPKRMPGGTLILIYQILWIVGLISLVVMNYPQVAIPGFVFMGALLFWAVKSTNHKKYLPESHGRENKG